MQIDLADIARGRRIVAVAALETAQCARRPRPKITLSGRIIRRFLWCRNIILT